MSQEIVVRAEKNNELEKSILKTREEEEEEEEEEDYDDSIKGKTTVKFVVEPEDQIKDSTKLVIESNTGGRLSPRIETGLTEIFSKETSVQTLQHFERDGLIENQELQLLVESPPLESTSVTVAETNIEKSVDRVEEKERIVESGVEPRIVENQVAEKILQDAMSKAFQDAAYTSAGEQPPIQRLQRSPDLVEHQQGEMGTFYPTAATQQSETRKISSPAQLSPVKVYLHSDAAERDLGHYEPNHANGGHVQRPPWTATTQAPTHQQWTQQTPPVGPKSPISHQKLADQVAQKAIRNQAQQEQTRQKYKETREAVAPPGPKVPEYTPPISRSPQQQEQYVYQQQTFPQAQNYQRAISPKPPLRDDSLERRMKVTKLHDPTSWVVQESVTESQMVKGAPWARYQVEKKERVWPPPSPKMIQGSAEYAPIHDMRQYEAEAANPFQQKYPDIYEEQERKARMMQRPAAPTYQSYEASYNQQQQMRNSPTVQQRTVYKEERSSPHIVTYEYSQTHEPAGRPALGYTPQPMQKFVSHTQDPTIQRYEPIRPLPFKPQWSAATVRPDLNQPLTLDTSQTTYSQFYQQQSPRTIYKPQGPVSSADVAQMVPPGQQHTSTPVLPFTKAPERQDYERFQSQYSPGRMVYQAQPESYQYVTNQVASVPGGTSFARVQNVSRVNFDPSTGQPYKEDVQRIVRTTHTVPKTWQH